MKTVFIGGGNMASAILGGYLAQGFEPSEIAVIERNAERREQLQRQWGGGMLVKEHPDQSIEQYDVILMAVKPQDMSEAARILAPYLSRNSLIISIAAGIRLDCLSQWFSGHNRLIRAMPNTPALVGEGITGLAALSGVTSGDREKAEILLGSVSQIVWFEKEEELDAVTAVSGCGPAYVFYFIEALDKAAQELGLSPENSRQLALQTFLGASRLAAESKHSPAELRIQVTSKGGATEAALSSLEKHKVNELFIDAVKIAAEKSKALGR